MNAGGGRIVAVAPGGRGEALGLRPGDELVSIDGHVLQDVIDFRFYGAEDGPVLTVRRAGRELTLRGVREYGQPRGRREDRPEEGGGAPRGRRGDSSDVGAGAPWGRRGDSSDVGAGAPWGRRGDSSDVGAGAPWGLEFAEPLFDGVRTCGNRCRFCFLAGLPPGLRPSLYVRDDDYRLSFLTGSFVTLTNLDEDDWQRLAEQRLSPLYVSVQATDADLRRRLLGGRPIPDIREQIARLGESGIVVHAQVVICPGINDGAALAQTVGDLWALRGAVASVALVPVGLTSHHPLRARPMAAEQACEILTFAEGWRRVAYRKVGRRFVYPSDELYLLAGRPVPGARAYDGFPQLANGVGPVRRFLDEWDREERRLTACPAMAIGSATLVSGRLFWPILEGLLPRLSQALGAQEGSPGGGGPCALGAQGGSPGGGGPCALGIRCEAVAVENRFLGPDVTVAGLLTAQDVVAQLRGRELGELVVLPRSMFDAAGERTLDGWTPERLAAALRRPVALAGSPAELVASLM